jgi:hypothetical protein
MEERLLAEGCELLALSFKLQGRIAMGKRESSIVKFKIEEDKTVAQPTSNFEPQTSNLHLRSLSASAKSLPFNPCHPRYICVPASQSKI